MKVRTIRAAAAMMCLFVGTIAAATALLATLLFAQRSDMATLHVSMNVVPSGTVSVTPVDFGNYDPVVANATQPLNAQGTVTIVCTPNTRITLEMDQGLNASGTSRQLGSGTDFLAYELFKDPGRSQVWGQNTQALRILTPMNSSAPITHVVYGRIPAEQNVTPGDYTDTIEVVLHF